MSAAVEAAENVEFLPDGIHVYTTRGCHFCTALKETAPGLFDGSTDLAYVHEFDGVKHDELYVGADRTPTEVDRWPSIFFKMEGKPTTEYKSAIRTDEHIMQSWRKFLKTP